MGEAVSRFLDSIGGIKVIVAAVIGFLAALGRTWFQKRLQVSGEKDAHIFKSVYDSRATIYIDVLAQIHEAELATNGLVFCGQQDSKWAEAAERFARATTTLREMIATSPVIERAVGVSALEVLELCEQVGNTAKSRRIERGIAGVTGPEVGGLLAITISSATTYQEVKKGLCVPA